MLGDADKNIIQNRVSSCSNSQIPLGIVGNRIGALTFTAREIHFAAIRFDLIIPERVAADKFRIVDANIAERSHIEHPSIHTRIKELNAAKAVRALNLELISSRSRWRKRPDHKC